MSTLVPVVLFGWPLFAIVLFGLLPARTAVGLSYALAWCFLPVAAYSIPGIPDYTKSFAAVAGVFLGLSIFHAGKLFQFRVSWLDSFPIAFLFAPLISSLVNGLGVYDGLSGMAENVIEWGAPYLAGRFTYKQSADFRALAIAILITGLLYVPLCLWEIRMSPQLHMQVYGFRQHDFTQTVRMGGFRPVVFMQHGLQVSLWMGAVVLIASLAWSLKAIRGVLGVPIAFIVPIFWVTFLLMKSVGAYIEVFSVLALFAVCRIVRSSFPILLVPVAVLGYIVTRGSGIYDGNSIVRIAEQCIGEDRASSLEFRINNENLLAAHARQRPVFGWGGWSRSKPNTEDGKPVVTDGLWIIVFGTNGIFGVSAIYLSFLVAPVIAMIRNAKHNRKPEYDDVWIFVFSSVAFGSVLDTLPNAMLTPMFSVIIGGLVNYCSLATIGEDIAVLDERDAQFLYT